MVVPPLTLHSPHPPLLTAAWMALRETLLCGRVDRAWKEAIAAAVSRTNTCSFCVDAHTMMLHAADSHDAARWITGGTDARLPDARMRALTAWAIQTRSPGANLLADPPFASQEAPEIMGTALVFHYINRMVQVFIGDSPIPLRTSALGSALRRLGGLRFAAAVHAPLAPGASLALAGTEAPALPADLAWAGASPWTAAALAHWATAIEAAGAAALDGRSRDAIEATLSAWDGTEPALGRAWLDAPLSSLDVKAASVVRLCLLAALAPARVTADDVAGFRRYHEGDADLVAALAWASHQAARRTLRWCRAPSA